jgi:hypothetical protein
MLAGYINLNALSNLFRAEVQICIDMLAKQAYNEAMRQKAPTSALTLTGAEIRTAEAERTFQSHYRPSSVRSQGDFTDDVPQLPYRM